MTSWIPLGQFGFAQGITHSFARFGNAITPPLIAALVAIVTWRGPFVVLGPAALVWVAAWCGFFRDEPHQHKRMTEAELAILPPARITAGQRPVAWLELASRIMPVTFVDFCYGWTLWLFLSWIPSFFVQNFHLNLKDSALFSAGVFFAGVVGDTLGGVVSDLILRRTDDVRLARCSVIAAGLFGGFLFLIPFVFIHELTITAACLTLAFFCPGLVVAPISSGPLGTA